jgi:hypothetical protein
MLLHGLLTFALLMSPDIDTPPKYKAWIENHEVSMQTDAGPRRIVHDALAADPVAASPTGDRVVYAVINTNFDAPHCGNTPKKYVVLADASGQSQWRASIDEACQDFDKFEWIDDHRIGVMLCGHANCFYWVLDAGSGKILKKFGGGFDFLWSHNREWVAHRQIGMTPDKGGALMFNDDRPVYPAFDRATDTFPNRDIGDLAWSPDDKWVSFCETEHPSENGYIVLVSPQGKALRTRLPEGVRYSDKVEWTDTSHLQINTFGTQGHLVPYKFVISDNALREISPYSN